MRHTTCCKTGCVNPCRKKGLKTLAASMANQVRMQTDALMFGFYNEPHERALVTEPKEAVTTVESQSKPEGSEALVNTLVDLM